VRQIAQMKAVNDEFPTAQHLRFRFLDMSLPPLICVHLRNLRPMPSRILRVSVPLWESQYHDDSSFPLEHS
jgi:hypothetical protein